MPPFKEECLVQLGESKSLELIYPKNNSKIYIPINLDETASTTVFEASHYNNEITIFGT